MLMQACDRRGWLYWRVVIPDANWEWWLNENQGELVAYIATDDPIVIVVNNRASMEWARSFAEWRNDQMYARRGRAQITVYAAYLNRYVGLLRGVPAELDEVV